MFEVFVLREIVDVCVYVCGHDADDFEAAVEASLRERFDVVECGWDEALAHWREDQPVSTKIEQL